MNEDAARLDELLARVRRIEDAVGRITGAVAALAQAHQQGVHDVLFSQATYLGENRALTYLRTGQKIFVDTRSVDIGTHLLLGGHWEHNYATAFLRLLKPGDTVLDVGANHGVYTLLAAPRVAPGGRVYAFEPSQGFHDLIAASVSVNGLGALVTLEKRALAERARTTTLVGNVNWSGGAHLESGADAQAQDSRWPIGTETIECIALDDYFPDPAQKVDVVKMDIEGAEGLALKGMAKVVDRSPNLKMMMEFCPRMLSRFDCDAGYVLDFFRSRDFMCWTIDDAGGLVPARWESLLAEPDAIRNVVVSRQGLR